MIAVLVVDDERQIRRALSLNLGARGYEVYEAATGEQALTIAADRRPDAILLDLGLPGMDGIMVIEAIRGWSAVPIIVLTVRDEERSKVRALDAGADDYVTKPFGMAELLARLRAVLRRVPEGAPENPVVDTGSVIIDLAAHRASNPDGADVRLTPTEWAIVEHLVRHAGRLVTYRQLTSALWGATADPDSSVLRVHMAHIRRKLEPNPSRPASFLTESGMGYRFQTAGLEVESIPIDSTPDETGRGSSLF
jgi:two-component system, OmpR family, KDP operon response regulator KdpE